MNHSGATGRLNNWPYCSLDPPLLLHLLPTRKVTEFHFLFSFKKTSRKSSFLERIHFDSPSEKPPTVLSEAGLVSAITDPTFIRHSQNYCFQ